MTSKTTTSTADAQPGRIVTSLFFLAWLGTLVHDLVEFGGPSVQNSIPMLLIAIGLVLGWRKWANGRFPMILLTLLYALVNLLGAATSVLPLQFWPFVPEQSLTHYGVHVFWVVTQLPLLWLVWDNWREGDR